MTFWVRCAAMVLFLSFGYGIGLYAIAPDGGYNNYALEESSHDPSKYFWGILLPRLWYVLSVHGMLISMPLFIILLGAVSLLTIILARRRVSVSGWFMTVSPWFLCLGGVLIGFILGLITTIAVGKNPGVI